MASGNHTLHSPDKPTSQLAATTYDKSSPPLVPIQTPARRRGRERSPLHPSPTNLAWTHVLLIIACLIFFFPIYQIVKVSLSGASGLLSLEYNVLPQDITFENYANSLADPTFLRSVLNSFIYAGGTTLISLVLAVSAAYAFSRMRFFGRRTTLWSMLILQAFPATATIIPLYVLFSRFGLINTYQGLIIAYTAGTLPFSIWMVKSFFDTIPKELEEAARVDGATVNQSFVRVILPLALPALAITAMLGFVTGWSEFILAITFINSEALKPFSVRLYSILGQQQTEWGFFAAQAVLFSIPPAVVFFAFQKYLVGGLTVGGVKG